MTTTTERTTQQAWIINHYAVGDLKGTELELVERPIPEPADGEVLIKTILLTLDPSNRIWLSAEEDYWPQLQIGDVMRGFVVGRVVKSCHKNFQEGDHLFAALGWQQYAVVNGDALIPAAGALKFKPHPDIPFDAYASVLGITGWTAYVGMGDIGQVKAGDNVLVSGAAGATGLVACQIAKARGARVIGIAGGQEKCDFLTSEIGLDGCIDYKSTDNLSAAMADAFPDGIQVFFDNVGGPTLDAALENMAIGGCIVVSGSVSQYLNYGDNENIYGITNTALLVVKRVRMQGFLITDHLDQMDTILASLEQQVLNGSLQYKNTEVIGLENAQDALPRIFTGQQIGKLVVKVA